jgi:integrase/recombinase XerD
MTISRILDKKRITTTGVNAGRYHIKIRLTFTREKKTYQKFFMTGLFANEDEFSKIIEGKTRKDRDLAEKETKLSLIYEQAKQILKDNPFIDPDDFAFELTNAGSYKDPLTLMESYANDLKANGQIGNYNYYKLALSSFKTYMNGSPLSFGAVTPKWLMKYEKWMLERGRSISTVGMYCIAMRTVFNLAIDKKKLSDKLYPFGKGKYVIPTSKGRKLALTEEQKDTVLSYLNLDPFVQKAVDFWKFSYFCYGMNFADIARIKFGDIKENSIIFDRTKTIRTERERSFIEIPLRQEVWQVIEKHGNIDQKNNPNAFVFNILRDGLTPEQIQDRVHDFVADANEGLAKACSEEQMNLPRMTTYWARHTFATIAYKKGAGIEFIQKALGHSDPKTTLRYIESFDIETKRMVSNWL